MNLKSVTARAVRPSGAAWSDGTPARAVDVKIDDSERMPARLTAHTEAPYARTSRIYDWKAPRPGEHTVPSRATMRTSVYVPYLLPARSTRRPCMRRCGDRHRRSARLWWDRLRSRH